MGGVIVVGGGGRAERVEGLGAHCHRESLIIWSGSGTAMVGCGERDWIVPAGHGMWIPAGVPHRVEVLRSGTGSAVFLAPVRWPEPTALVSTPLVRELVRHLGGADETVGGPGSAEARRRAEAVLLDLLEPAPATSVPLPRPADDRLLAITGGLLADPADDRDLAQWAFDAGAGMRTVSRLFAAQTGMTFGQWRTNARIRAAITLLAAGTPVATTARRVGFTKPAAFGAAFRRVTGQPPSAFLPESGDGSAG